MTTMSTLFASSVRTSGGIVAWVVTVVSAIALTSATSLASGDPPQPLVGVLQVITPDDGQSYYAIDAGKEIEAPSDAGGMRKARILQIAGLDETMVDKASALVGKRVTVTGRPFGAFTVYHYTDVLWLAIDLNEAEGGH
jgi:hypothetical protein